MGPQALSVFVLPTKNSYTTEPQIVGASTNIFLGQVQEEMDSYQICMKLNSDYTIYHILIQNLILIQILLDTNIKMGSRIHI
jgi:hypothetical protein